MRKSIIIIALAFIAIFISSNLVAQNGKTSVSIGAGQFFNSALTSTSNESFLVTSTTTQTSQFTPMIAVKLERLLDKDFSIGLEYSHVSAHTERTTHSGALNLLFFSGPTTTNEKIDSKISGVSFNIKGIMYADSACKLYVGANFGALKSIDNMNSTTVGANTATGLRSEQKTEQNTTILAQLNGGMRYFVTKNVGFYGEIGWTFVGGANGAAGQIGMLYRF